MKCPNCQAENTDQARFCRLCGQSLQAPVSTIAAAAMTLPQTAPPPAPVGPLQQVLKFMDRCSTEPTGLLGAAVVLVLALLLNWALWTPLGWIPGIFNKFLSLIGPKSCGPFSRGILVPFCGAALAIYSHLASLIILGILLRFRKALVAGVKYLLRMLPQSFHFLGGPVVATLLFTMAWAGVPFHFFDRPGIVRDGLFPTVVGVLCYLILRFDPAIKRALGALWDSREKLSPQARLIIAALIVLGIAYLLTGRVNPPVRDQWTVIFSLFVGYFLFAPKESGELAEKALEIDEEVG